MSRRRTPPAKKKGTQVPVILYVFWPIWGPIVRKIKTRKREQAKREQASKADLVTMVKAVKTGKLDELEDVARAVKAKGWHYQNRHVVDAALVAFGLAASKLLVLGPWLLPLFGMLIFGACFFGAPVWLSKVGRKPVPELKKKLLDRELIEKAPSKVRSSLAWICSPFAGAALVALFGLWWWATPLSRRTAIITWVVVVTVTLGVRAWRFRVRPYEVASTGTREGDWVEFIAAKVASAAGSILQGPTEDFHHAGTGRRLGWTGGVILPKGSAGATAIIPAIKKNVATTYGVGVEDVMAERFTTPDGRRDERRFVLTVLDEPGSNAVFVVHEYDGSDFDPELGTWTQGVRADWKPAAGQLFKPGVGGFSTHFSGETGGGKSEGMETMLRSVTAKGVVAPWIIDLGGATFVDWKDHVEIFVDTPADAVQLLGNHKNLIGLRQRKLGKMREIIDGEDVGPRRVYPIDREHPCVCGIFDEWEFALGDTEIGRVVLELSEDILTQQRKVVCPFCAAGQSTGLKAGFKNSQRARTQFQAGNMIAFKNNSESGAQAFGKQIVVNPSNLPLEHKGSCYLTSNADARDAMVRSRWVRRPKLWDDQIDIPQLPSDEVDVLTKGLSIRPTLVQVPANMPSPRKAESLPIPVGQRPDEPEVAEPVALHTAKQLSKLATEVVEWVIQQERPVKRQEVVAEFGRRMRANSSSVDNALKEAREAGALKTEKPGVYESAKEGVA